MPSLLEESLGKPALYSAPCGSWNLSFGSSRCLCRAHGLAHSLPRPPALQPHPSTTPTALTPRLLWASTSWDSQEPPEGAAAPHCTDEDSSLSLCTVMVFSWSPTLAQERAFMSPTPFSWHHSTLLALLGGGGAGQEMARPRATPTPPIVWVPPLAPWDFGQWRTLSPSLEGGC